MKIPLQNYLIKYLVTHGLNQKDNLLKNLVEKHTSRLTDFIALTAHELRTPLSIALFQVEDCKNSFASNKEMIKDLGTIENSLENLKTLTDRLFEIQRFDLDKIILKKSEIDLVELLNNLTSNFKRTINNKTLTFKNHKFKKLICNIDKGQIRQVIHNILNNAARFGSEISIDLSKQDKHAKISICDNGPGISDENKLRIFNKFQTTNNSSSQGLGLGLYICKKIIDLHFGEINITDNQPKGICVNILLPL